MAALTQGDRAQLYLIAWQGKSIPKKWLQSSAVERLKKEKLVKEGARGLRATAEGWDTLSPMAQMACQRPLNYANLSSEAQWAIDKDLAILDWDGS